MIGTELGQRYRILDELGTGGTATVYLAEHKHLRRKEAIKILNPAIADAAHFVSRFRREARAANRLQHRNIVSVYDFGQLPDGRFFLAMEYAEGDNVRTILRRVVRFPVPRTLHVLTQLADAVDHAHSRGVIHRDLKPQNLILVEGNGHEDLLKVLDFGIAKIIAPEYEDSLGVTKKGDIYGTPGYMAPEQYRGTGDDPRIDIYALGCIGFELLTGELPFRGGWGQVWQAISRQPAPRPRERCPEAGFPAELDEVIVTCLARDADERFQTGREIAAALRGVPGFPATKPTGSRRTYRVIPRSTLSPIGQATDFGDEQTDAETQEVGSTARDVWEAFGAEEPVSVNAPTQRVSLESLQSEFHEVLHALAETLVDLGCCDFQLSLGVVELNELECELERIASEMDELEAHGDAVEQRSRERESSLRFAIGELRFELDQARAREQQVDPDMEYQIGQLEERLAALANERQSVLTETSDRAISLAAEQAEKEDELGQLCLVLNRVVEQVVAPFLDDAPVAELHQRLRTVRGMMALAENAPGRPD